MSVRCSIVKRNPSTRERLAELESDREEAERLHDPERAARARLEYDAIAEQLVAAVGRGGRDRRIGSPAERARLNVTRAVKNATGRIARHDQPLGDHLTACVRTGWVCVYRPDVVAPVAWHVSPPKQRVRLERGFHPPKTRYALTGDVSIAYQVLGDGPIDVVLSLGWVSHLDYQWADPTFSRFLRRLAAVGRLLVYDKRGTGLSDPVGAAPTFEERMDDIRAVMDARRVSARRARGLLGRREHLRTVCRDVP